MKFILELTCVVCDSKKMYRKQGTEIKTFRSLYSLQCHGCMFPDVHLYICSSIQAYARAIIWYLDGASNGDGSILYMNLTICIYGQVLDIHLVT